MSVDVLASVSAEIERLIQSGGYVGLALAVVAESVFPPIPSEVILPLAGFEVWRGQLSYLGALLAATGGSLIGAWILYAISRRGGRPLVLRLYPALRVGRDELARGERWFGRWGDWIVVGGRVIPGARSLVSLPAGTLRMPFWRFSALTVAGSLVWNAALIALGQALGANWRGSAAVVGPFATAVAVGAVVVAAGALLHWRSTRAKRRTRGGAR